jgi:hypothetical protein
MWTLLYRSPFMLVFQFFRRLRKIAKNDYWLRHVCPSVCRHGKTQFPLDGFSWTLVFLYFFENMSRKFKFYYNRTRITGTLHEDQIPFWSYLAHLFFKSEIFDTKLVEKINMHILCSITFFRKICRLWDMWIYTVEPERPQMTIWPMRIACWIPKATDIHSEYAIFIALLLEKWLHERASVLRLTYFACLVTLENRLRSQQRITQENSR